MCAGRIEAFVLCPHCPGAKLVLNSCAGGEAGVRRVVLPGELALRVSDYAEDGAAESDGCPCSVLGARKPGFDIRIEDRNGQIENAERRRTFHPDIARDGVAGCTGERVRDRSYICLRMPKVEVSQFGSDERDRPRTDRNLIGRVIFLEIAKRRRTGERIW